MKLLFIGDVVGVAGCEFVAKKLPALKRRYEVDVTVINGENSAQGNGITKSSAQSLLHAGADLLTTGNHAFRRREHLSIFERADILRPANYPDGCIGRGFTTLDLGKCRLAVVNLQGTVFMDALDNPFTAIDRILPQLDTPNILVDLHGEATSEKKAMGYYLAGKVTAVIGTHTHVQTADEAIIDDHTGYLTDAGMTGPERSVLGVDVTQAVDKQRFHFPVRFTEASGACFLCGVVITFDPVLGKCTKIERIIERD